MWLSVGSSNSLIDVIGHVGMCGIRGSHYQPRLWASLFAHFWPYLSGPKSQSSGVPAAQPREVGFGPKPLKRAGPGSPVSLPGRRYARSRQPRDLLISTAALHRRLPEGLQPTPDDQQWGGVEDRAVRTRDDADEESEREALQRVAARDKDRDQDEDDS